MAINAFSDSFSFDVTADETGKPTGVSNVEQSFMKATTNTVLGTFNGGKSAGIGLGHTVGQVANMYIGHVAFDGIEHYTGKNLDPIWGE